MVNVLELESPAGHVCSHKFAFFLDNWIRRWIQKPRKLLGEYISPGDTVMDVGCGPGFFTIDMAKLAGPSGRVIAADIQAPMLDRVRRKAARHGVVERISYHLCDANGIGLTASVDFILAYYMVHETPSAQSFLREAATLLNPQGQLLVVEPKFHVSAKGFQDMVGDGQKVGLRVVDYPQRKGGWSVVFARA